VAAQTFPAPSSSPNPLVASFGTKRPWTGWGCLRSSAYLPIRRDIHRHTGRRPTWR
jgi:hypothetical protein